MGNPFSAVINGVEHVGKSMEDLAGKATGELESLGIGMFGGAEAFIQFLIHEGEDPVHVISTLWSHATGHGAEPSSALGELANGVLTYGLVNYCTQMTNQAVAPIKNALTEHNTRGQQVVSVHQTTLTVMQNKLNTLTGNASTANVPMTWQGSGADAMLTSFGGISQFIEQLNEQMHTNQQQIALNNAFIQGLELTGAVAIGMAVLDILLVILDAVILVVGTGVAPGLGTLAGAGIDVLLDAGVLALELDILAMMLAADALIWLIGTLAIYVANHPPAIHLPPLTLPLPKPATPVGVTHHSSLVYEPNPKHGPTQKGNIGAEPKNGQAALDNSVPVKPTSTRRVGVDPNTGEIVVFDETYPGKGVFHGHVRSWDELTQEMKNALIKAGLVDKRGRPIKKK